MSSVTQNKKLANRLFKAAASAGIKKLGYKGPEHLSAHLTYLENSLSDQEVNKIWFLCEWAILKKDERTFGVLLNAIKQDNQTQSQK